MRGPKLGSRTARIEETSDVRDRSEGWFHQILTSAVRRLDLSDDRCQSAAFLAEPLMTTRAVRV